MQCLRLHVTFILRSCFLHHRSGRRARARARGYPRRAAMQAGGRGCGGINVSVGNGAGNVTPTSDKRVQRTATQVPRVGPNGKRNIFIGGAAFSSVGDFASATTDGVRDTDEAIVRTCSRRRDASAK